MLTNVLNLQEVTNGNRIKQGDKSEIVYKLVDENDDVDRFGMAKATVYLLKNDIINYQVNTRITGDNEVKFTVEDILPKGVYKVEIHVDLYGDDFVFPSDTSTKIEITSSVIGDYIDKFYNNENLFEKLFQYGISKGYFSNKEQQPPAVVETSKSALNGLTGAFIGDSITESNFRTTKNYHQFIADRTGLNVVNLGISGTGYIDRLNAVDSIVEQPDFIVVFLGTNDFSGVTGSKILGNSNDTDAPTLASYIYTLLTNIMNKFPNTPIVTITPLPRIESNPMNENQGKNSYKLVELVEIIKSISKRLAIPCLDLYHNSHLRVWFDEVNQHFFSYEEGQSDGLHPNYHGHEYISHPIQSFLEQHVVVGEKQPYISDGKPVINISPKATFETTDDGSTIAIIPNVLPTWIDNQSFMLRVPVETLNLTGKKITEADYEGHKISNPNDMLANNPFWYSVSTYPKGEYNRIDEINDFVQHLNYVSTTDFGKTYEPITIKLKYK